MKLLIHDFLISLVNFSLFLRNIILTTRFSNTLHLCSVLTVRDEVPRYKRQINISTSQDMEQSLRHNEYVSILESKSI
jgi:hypothetical protein